ncbi:hypothetical protein GCM10007071_32280 [Marinobacter zhanjiangensis]|uniref:Uncharacterized protein n=1 Tax=Marinobacter zhanjiangensis TaxID=578215 RepID=A0ABQ3B6V3_9GAMM|nr:hypothetical protein GCM10007071_32280 [Marinobacter zhanjiangensis]
MVTKAFNALESICFSSEAGTQREDRDGGCLSGTVERQGWRSSSPTWTYLRGVSRKGIPHPGPGTGFQWLGAESGQWLKVRFSHSIIPKGNPMNKKHELRLFETGE